jgi:biotin carboxyl carrier protein
MLDGLSMPKRRVTPQRGSPDQNAVFDDDSAAGQGAPASEAARLPFDARLVIEKGAYAGKVLKLDGGTALIGRSSKCELTLKGSAGVSRRHCKLQLIAGRYAVIDLSSRNGTVVNGETVARKFLNDGDLLEIGDERMRFILTKKPAPVDDDVADLATALTVLPIDKKSRDRPAARTGSAVSAQRPAADRTAAVGAAAPPPRWDDDDLAPRGVADEPLGPPLDELSGPYLLKPQRSGFGAMRALLMCALLLVVALGVVAWDLAFGERRSLLWVRTHAPALAAPLEGALATLADAASPAARKNDALPQPIARDSEGDAGSALPAAPAPSAVVASGDPVAPLADAGEQSPHDAGGRASEPTAPTEPTEPVIAEPVAQSIVVTASAGGRIASLRVKPGSIVKRGQALVTLEAPAALRRKLTSLRDEERAFEQAVKKGNAAARRDLDAVRAEIVELAPRVRSTPLVSDAGGTVVDVLVKDGQLIKSGESLVSLAP